MTCNAVVRQRQQTVSVQAHVRNADVKQPQAAGRSQNRMHEQKALMEYLFARPHDVMPKQDVPPQHC